MKLECRETRKDGVSGLEQAAESLFLIPLFISLALSQQFAVGTSFFVWLIATPRA
jgi:hypothetical protein